MYGHGLYLLEWYSEHIVKTKQDKNKNPHMCVANFILSGSL